MGLGWCVAGAMDQLRARLGLARVTLGRSVGTVSHGPMSAAQAGAAKDVADRVVKSIGPAEKAALVELAALCAFTATDMATVLNSILGSVGSAGLVRRTAQNFEPFVHYLPEKVWNLLLDPDSVQDYRVDVLHAWLRTMGLRNPTEGTIKLINSF